MARKSGRQEKKGTNCCFYILQQRCGHGDPYCFLMSVPWAMQTRQIHSRLAQTASKAKSNKGQLWPVKLASELSLCHPHVNFTADIWKTSLSYLAAPGDQQGMQLLRQTLHAKQVLFRAPTYSKRDKCQTVIPQ